MRAQPRHRRVGAAVAAVLALALAGCAPSGEVDVDAPPQVHAKLPDPTVEQLQAAVTHAMAASGASGAIVGVWAPWSGEWVAGLGTERIDGGAKVTPDMRFRIGTVTRTMTCDVLFALAAEGRLSLDDSVTSYVSGVADLQDVTLGQLCDGTSGIGAYRTQLMAQWLAKLDRTWNPRELVSYGLGQTRTTEPGIAYRDSDAGYVLLGLALERAGGATAAELVEQHVTEPLALERTTLPSGSATTGLLDGYYGTRGEDGAWDCAAPIEITALSSTVGYTDSGVLADISDLGHYAQAVAEGSLLPDGVDRLANEVPASANAPAWYTAGGGVFHAGSLIGQHGGYPGYLTAAYSDPGTGLTVAVVLNNSTIGGEAIGHLAWELAAIASKSPAADGETTPEAGLPWTAEQFHTAIAEAAICPLPAE